LKIGRDRQVTAAGMINANAQPSVNGHVLSAWQSGGSLVLRRGSIPRLASYQHASGRWSF